MKRERHGTDEVIRKLREAEAMEAAGASPAEVVRKLAVSEPVAAGCCAGAGSSEGWATSRSSGSRSSRTRTVA